MELEYKYIKYLMKYEYAHEIIFIVIKCFFYKISSQLYRATHVEKQVEYNENSERYQ